jgi:hypothetical protein
MRSIRRPSRRFRRGLRAAGALVLTLAGTSAAHAAATLATPPVLTIGLGNSVLYCTIRNVGASPVTVKIDGYGFNEDFFPGPTLTLDPREGGNALVQSAPGVPAPVTSQCRFQVSGSAKNVRAAAVYFDPTTDDYTLAVPAR